MANKKQLQKLELTWIGKGEEPKLEPRILIENPEYSYGDPDSENMLIHGDNLLALRGEAVSAGQVIAGSPARAPRSADGSFQDDTPCVEPDAALAGSNVRARR